MDHITIKAVTISVKDLLNIRYEIAHGIIGCLDDVDAWIETEIENAQTEADDAREAKAPEPEVSESAYRPLLHLGHDKDYIHDNFRGLSMCGDDSGAVRTGCRKVTCPACLALTEVDTFRPAVRL